MSHCDFFPWQSSWSLLRCFQTHTTQLLDAKIGRLREQGQHSPKHWSLLLLAHVILKTANNGCPPFYYGLESCFQGLIQSDPTNQEREYRPTSILHPRRWCLILVELCETEVCFLHIQLIGTNVWLPETHNVPPEVDFESSRSPAKSESWNSPSRTVLQYYPQNNIVYIHMYDDQAIQAFFTSSGPFGDSTSKFVHWPENFGS